MKSEIIKQTFKLGNSAGVLLPVDWKDKRVKIQLVDKSITQDIIEILEERDLLKNTIGIYLTGSYAREEETEASDVDVLIITDSIDKQIKIREYELILVSKEKFEKSLKTNLYIVSLINESKTILNNSFLKENKNKIKNVSLKKHIEEIKSIIKINETGVMLDEQLNKNVSDETMYSIILRLRELYLIICLKNNKNPSTKEFVNLIRKIATEESYNAYLRIKNDLKSKEIIPIREAKALLEYTKNKIKGLKE